MASFAALTPTTLVAARATVAPRSSFAGSSSPVLGLPKISMKGRVRCSVEEGKSPASEGGIGVGMSSLAAMCAATMSGPAMALVDERLSTEGTGLPFGLSNNLLGWILLGVFGLIWSFYFAYAGSLDEDEESGLSL